MTNTIIVNSNIFKKKKMFWTIQKYFKNQVWKSTYISDVNDI